ncbi:MAG: hypothetical protein KQH83_12525 [Actinobacteria bacterium]|nr:hypothetical protein [Actinomycetota bacterium]
MPDEPRPPSTARAMLDAARDRIQRATPEQAERAASGGALLVDLRCPGERERTGMIPNSIAIGRSVLEWRADPASPWRDERLAQPEQRVLLVCEDGWSSSLAAASLRDLGFRRAGDVDGGMTRWLAEGRPVVPPGDAG